MNSGLMSSGNHDASSLSLLVEMDASPLLADSFTGFWAPMHLLVIIYRCHHCCCYGRLCILWSLVWHLVTIRQIKNYRSYSSWCCSLCTLFVRKFGMRVELKHSHPDTHPFIAVANERHCWLLLKAWQRYLTF